jgi:hypothetical protein
VKVRFMLKNVDGSAFYFFFIAKNNENLLISVYLKFNEEDSLRYLYPCCGVGQLKSLFSTENTEYDTKHDDRTYFLAFRGDF